MRVFHIILVATLTTFLGSFVPMTTAQGLIAPGNNLRAFCAIWAFIGFIIERIRCDNEIEDQRDSFLNTVCEKRFGTTETNCRRCLDIEDREACDSDLGSNNMDDTPGAVGNDDCEFDTNFNVCLDEVEPPA